MLNLLLIFLAVTSLTYFYHFRRSRKRLYELAAKIPGPFDWPLIGSIHVGLGRGPTEIFDYMLSKLHSLPVPMRFWVGPTLFIVVDDPEHLAVVLNSQDCVKRSYMYRFLGFDRGLFNAPPDLWRKLRKHLTPAFGQIEVRGFVRMFNQKADALVKKLEASSVGHEFDFMPEISGSFIESSLGNVLGMDLDGSDDFKKDYKKNTDRLFTIRFHRMYKAWLQFDWIYKLTPTYREERKRTAIFEELSRKAFNKWKNSKRQPPDSQPLLENDETNIRKPRIFIENIERVATRTDFMDEACILSNLETILFAANDSSSLIAASTILMLAMYPEVQQRVYEEVVALAPDDYLDYDVLSKLTYLDMVLKETMRLFPVAPVLGRECEREMHIGEYILPVGAQIVIPVLKIHRDRAVWGNRSEEFDPENFSAENCAKRHPLQFLPFSGGIRNCSGIKYANANLKIVVTKMVKRFRMTTRLKLPELKFRLAIVMQVVNGHMITLEVR